MRSLVEVKQCFRRRSAPTKGTIALVSTIPVAQPLSLAFSRLVEQFLSRFELQSQICSQPVMFVPAKNVIIHITRLSASAEASAPNPWQPSS